MAAPAWNCLDSSFSAGGEPLMSKKLIQEDIRKRGKNLKIVLKRRRNIKLSLA